MKLKCLKFITFVTNLLKILWVLVFLESPCAISSVGVLFKNRFVKTFKIQRAGTNRLKSTIALKRISIIEHF